MSKTLGFSQIPPKEEIIEILLLMKKLSSKLVKGGLTGRKRAMHAKLQEHIHMVGVAHTNGEFGPKTREIIGKYRVFMSK